MSKFDDFDNNFDEDKIENTIKKAKRKSTIKNISIALVITIITIWLAVIFNNYIYITSSNKVIEEVDVSIESSIPNGYVSTANLTQGILGGKMDYNVSKVVGDRVVLLEKISQAYGVNQPLMGISRQSTEVIESEWAKVDTWESGYRKMVFFHPDIKYKEYPNDLKNMDSISGDKIIEMALSLDKGYTKDDIANLAFDMRNLKTKWIWLDTFSKNQMEEFKNEVKENDPKSCGIRENQVRGINYRDNKGNIYTGMAQFTGIYNAWLESLNSIETNKTLYDQLIKDEKDSASNINILGFIVEGTKEELKELVDKPYIKASTFGVAIDPLY